jgi:hypothetical protein
MIRKMGKIAYRLGSWVARLIWVKFNPICGCAQAQ